MEFILDADMSVLKFIIENLRFQFLDGFMKFISAINNNGEVWFFISFAMIFFKKTRKGGFIVLISLIAVTLVGHFGLKHIIDRARPFIVDPNLNVLIKHPTSSSFPSGHTASSFACAVAILLYNKKLGIPAIILASLIGYSRLYLGVHFPLDVLGGIILGIVIAVLVTYFYNLIEIKIKSKKITNEA